MDTVAALEKWLAAVEVAHADNHAIRRQAAEIRQAMARHRDAHSRPGPMDNPTDEGRRDSGSS
jgi:hypothetical protein